MDQVAIIDQPWRDPLAAARPFAEEAGLLLLAGPDGWTYLALRPERALRFGAEAPADPFTALAAALGPPAARRKDGPPFQGGWAGLLAYELGGRAEPVALPPHPDWPLLEAGLYLGLLA